MTQKDLRVKYSNHNYLEFNEVLSVLNSRFEEHKEKARKLIEGSK